MPKFKKSKSPLRQEEVETKLSEKYRIIDKESSKKSSKKTGSFDYKPDPTYITKAASKVVPVIGYASSVYDAGKFAHEAFHKGHKTHSGSKKTSIIKNISGFIPVVGGVLQNILNISKTIIKKR